MAGEEGELGTGQSVNVSGEFPGGQLGLPSPHPPPPPPLPPLPFLGISLTTSRNSLPWPYFNWQSRFQALSAQSTRPLHITKIKRDRFIFTFPKATVLWSGGTCDLLVPVYSTIIVLSIIFSEKKVRREVTVKPSLLAIMNSPIWRPSEESGSIQISLTPRKYVFDVTSIGQRSSLSTCNSVKVEMKFHLECKLHFPSAQLMLRQMHSTNVSESIEAKY